MRKTATRRTTKHTKAAPAIGYPIARMLAAIVAPIWCLPAVCVNVDWAQGAWNWNLAAAGMIATAALFVHGAFSANTLARTLLCGVAALALMAGNTLLAFTNLSHGTNAQRDQALARINSDHRISSQSSRILAARTAAAKIADGKPAGTLRAEIDTLTMANARRWESTGRCDPAAITARASMTLCARLATLKGQLEAALSRDALDAQLEALNREAAAAAAPASPDAFAENTTALLATVGVILSPEAKAALPAQRDLLRAVLLELAAALGPAAWLSLFAGAIAPTVQRGQSAQLMAKVAINSHELAKTGNASPSPFERFAADRLQAALGEFLPASEPWEAWLDWCRARGHEPGSRRSFGLRLGARFRHDPNNGRPRYLNVSLRRDGSVLVPLRARA